MKRLFCTFLCASVPMAGDAGCLDTRETAMAERAVFWAVAASSSSVARAACASTPLACSDDRGDLGVSLIAAKAAVQGPERLASLLRYNIDAGLSGSYTCHVLGAGAPMVKALQQLDADALESECKEQFQAAARANRELFNGVNVSAVCASPSDISSKVSELIDGLKNGEICADGDF